MGKINPRAATLGVFVLLDGISLVFLAISSICKTTGKVNPEY